MHTQTHVDGQQHVRTWGIGGKNEENKHLTYRKGTDKKWLNVSNKVVIVFSCQQTFQVRQQDRKSTIL